MPRRRTVRGAEREGNVVIKDHRRTRLKFALAYPNTYSTGMGNLGIRLLYELINNREDALCERFFFTGYGCAPRSLESGMSLDRFDVVGFSFQHEMDYLRALDMLASSGIPIHNADRRRPVVIAGGPSVTSNPMPLSPFIDFFVIGEVEPIIDSLLDLMPSKDPAALDSLPGVYRQGSSAERVFVRDLNSAYHAVSQVHSVSEDSFASSFLLEVSRGCSRGCRFCVECHLYHPKRERSLESIKRIVEEGMAITGLNKMMCISSAFFDHSRLREILELLQSKRLKFSLPSIRITDVKRDLIDLLAAGGQRTLTLAPETPCERLRAVINKRLDEGHLLETLSRARAAGISSLKLYFMVGIPGESTSDIGELQPLLAKIISTGFKPSSVHISVNPMIPKSSTSFQWAPMIDLQSFKDRLDLFRKICTELGIRRVEEMDYRWGAIQAYLSTSGAEASRTLELLIEDLQQGGAGDLGSWRRVLRGMGESFNTLYKPKVVDASLPWEPIKGTFSRSILQKEYERAAYYAKERDDQRRVP